jgi:hypothetical protein
MMSAKRGAEMQNFSQKSGPRVSPVNLLSHPTELAKPPTPIECKE